MKCFNWDILKRLVIPRDWLAPPSSPLVLRIDLGPHYIHCASIQLFTNLFRKTKKMFSIALKKYSFLVLLCDINIKWL